MTHEAYEGDTWDNPRLWVPAQRGRFRR